MGLRQRDAKITRLRALLAECDEVLGRVEQVDLAAVFLEARALREKLNEVLG